MIVLRCELEKGQDFLADRRLVIEPPNFYLPHLDLDQTLAGIVSNCVPLLKTLLIAMRYSYLPGSRLLFYFSRVNPEMSDKILDRWPDPLHFVMSLMACRCIETDMEW